MWVNGKPSTAFGGLVLQSHMAITLLEGHSQELHAGEVVQVPAGE
jgi:quercetin dioxygenase-like cupin family protein